MTRLASRATLPAMLILAVAVLALSAVIPPDTAAARPLAEKPRKAKAHHKQHVKKHAKRHAKKRKLTRGLRAVQIANTLTGIRYLWGGASPRSGFDCSGLVQYVFAKVGVALPHYTVSQYQRGRSVSRSSLRPGDLVFFSGLNHVGIYAGGGRYIHAPRTGQTVRWASLSSAPSYYGARRIVAA